MLKFYVTTIIMNHSCWLVDSTLALIDGFDESLIQDDESFSNASVVEHLRKIKDMLGSIVDWQQRACELFALNFLGIFLLQCSANCLLFFLLSTNSTNSYVAIYGLIIMLNEIFVSCWMGSRVVIRQEKLTARLQCVRWDRLKPQHTTACSDPSASRFSRR